MSDFNSSQPVRTESDGDVVVKLADASTPSQQLAIDSAGLLGSKLFDEAGVAFSDANPLPTATVVSGAEIDPRDVRALTSADVVTADQGAPNTAANGWTVKPTDGTNSQSYTGAGEAKVSVTQSLPAGSNTIGKVDILDGSGNSLTSQANGAQRALDVGVNVAGVQVDPRAIRALTSSDVVQANIKDGSGVAFSNSNPLPVYVVESGSATDIQNFDKASAVAAAGSANHDYTVPAGKTFYFQEVICSASGMGKYEVQQAQDGSTFVTLFVLFTTASSLNGQEKLSRFVSVPAGGKVRIIKTNRDKAAEDLYSTIVGYLL